MATSSDQATRTFVLLPAIQDATHVTLCFLSREDAERFRKLTTAYIKESGAGNGYGAYWVLLSAEFSFCEKIPKDATVNLKEDLVLKMLHDVIEARTAKNNPTITPPYTIGRASGAIQFDLGYPLPKRQRPTTGDMFRIIRDTKKRLSVSEGRVVRDLGKQLEVVSCHDETKGVIKPDAKHILVPTARVMKINDWLNR